MVEVRIVTTENIFTKNQNAVNTNKLDKMIAEETEWAEEANIERDRAKKRKEQEEKTIKTMIYCLIAVGIGVCLLLIFKIIKYAKELSKTPKEKIEQEIEYFREFPDNDATPAEVALLYYFDRKNAFKNNLSKIVSATILNLGLKKAITFEKNKINVVISENVDEFKLKEDEESIYELLEQVKNSNNSNTISMRDIENYAKTHDIEFLEKIDGIESKLLE